MKISYNWLKEYINIDLDYKVIAEILTDIGLEVEGIEKYESIKGGLEGIVIGKVVEKSEHPNADKLSVTKVDIGTGELLDIVCGASNVAAGQKVVVATVGTKLYNGDESFTIKKSKIRGEVSVGMICAEDELGIGTSHDGIMVLNNDVKVGTLAKDYFSIENDILFEIGLTPNRIDSASHIGVARDLAAFLSQNKKTLYKTPDVSNFKIDNTSLPIDVVVENLEACPRYSGITISGIEVEESPKWLQNKLKAIGLNPINNIVDCTNFILHETGHPLHAFDADKIKGQRIIVKTLPNKTPFKTLDESVIELSDADLMICNNQEGMCIAGVFGGFDSGVSNKTKNIFLESAYFNSVFVRRTSKRHQFATDSSFRFERGVDPNDTIYVLKRAALLIKELAGGNISSEIVDVYPNPIKEKIIEISYSNVHRLIGKKIPEDKIKTILQALEIEIVKEDDNELTLKIPTYRVDVVREPDVVEEILRIYGYNNIEIPNHVNSALSYNKKPNPEFIKNQVSDYLASIGFNEIMSNSLTKSVVYNKIEGSIKNNLVTLFNPLSSDLDVMRQNLLFGGLESVRHNINRKRESLKLFEFGNVYFGDDSKSSENPLNKYSYKHELALFITGKKFPLNWSNNDLVSFFDIKEFVEMIFKLLNLSVSKMKVTEYSDYRFTDALDYKLDNKTIAQVGMISRDILKEFSIDQEVLFANFNWDLVKSKVLNNNIGFKELPKYPEVRRDLALLLNEDVLFSDLLKTAYKIENKLLKEVVLFDVYKGKNIEAGKKSYAISFTLRDENKTLTDKQIDKIMNKLIFVYEKEYDAKVR